jgi:predicted SnoaL-like aldol condensation-catalyzing enzyme
MSPEENKAIVRHYIEAVWNEGDMQTVDDVVVPDLSSIGMVNQGREGIHRFFAMVQSISGHSQHC